MLLNSLSYMGGHEAGRFPIYWLPVFFFSPGRVSLVQKQLNMHIYFFAYKLLVCDVLVAVASLDLKITHQKCYFPFFVLALTC